MKSALMTLSLLFVTVIVTGLLFIYTGTFNVSATWKDPALLEWLLKETREISIKSHAKDIQENGIITGSQTQIENGFRSYREMCATCHSAPGQLTSPLAQGLNPSPPDLSKKREHEMSSDELFWVIKNGIRMTGMPAWGPTHKDDEIWDIVAFLKILPEISTADYNTLNRTVSAGHNHANEETSTGHSKAGAHNTEPTPKMTEDANNKHHGHSAPNH